MQQGRLAVVRHENISLSVAEACTLRQILQIKHLTHSCGHT